MATRPSRFTLVLPLAIGLLFVLGSGFGHSIPGGLALEYARRAPERLASTLVAWR